jgi:hypothetical protein
VFLIELIEDVIFDAWFEFLAWIVPTNKFGKFTRILVKTIVGIFTFVIFVLTVLGIFMIFSGELEIGIFTILMTIVLSTPQIVVGIIVRVVTKNKK